MVNFYLLQLKLGKITLDDVPTLWRSAVADKWHKITDAEYEAIQNAEEVSE